MKLIAKKGSNFEAILKEMVEKIKEGSIKAVELVEEYTGVRPLTIARIFHWGLVFRLIPEFSFEDKDFNKIDPCVLRKANKHSNFYVPAMRFNRGRKFKEKFEELANNYTISDTILKGMGISLVDYVRGVSYQALPYYDSEKDVYYMICNIGVIRLFDKKLIPEDDFTVSYDNN